ncbi:hypothetical protein PLESTB_001817700 [Pleodorina starrii]|uniref:Uncharacterized protein n=1 Tax=Pleodorina starrii TaxID=330485 RepID=A0A9W6C198_9CHLO|nr:hypothetical protein PLESTM_001403800 [Pleodorina starrii]GLC61909.1 hypothetical protein PLESTB_001817700 [Pleodorina starrii]GLC75890.1 hypothetical protein PLESTF_001702500 [Pleodorina starrii]
MFHQKLGGLLASRPPPPEDLPQEAAAPDPKKPRYPLHLQPRLPGITAAAPGTTLGRVRAIVMSVVCRVDTDDPIRGTRMQGDKAALYVLEDNGGGGGGGVLATLLNYISDDNMVTPRLVRALGQVVELSYLKVGGFAPPKQRGRIAAAAVAGYGYSGQGHGYGYGQGGYGRGHGHVGSGGSGGNGSGGGSGDGSVRYNPAFSVTLQVTAATQVHIVDTNVELPVVAIGLQQLTLDHEPPSEDQWGGRYRRNFLVLPQQPLPAAEAGAVAMGQQPLLQLTAAVVERDAEGHPHVTLDVPVQVEMYAWSPGQRLAFASRLQQPLTSRRAVALLDAHKAQGSNLAAGVTTGPETAVVAPDNGRRATSELIEAAMVEMLDQGVLPMLPPPMPLSPRGAPQPPPLDPLLLQGLAAQAAQPEPQAQEQMQVEGQLPPPMPLPGMMSQGPQPEESAPSPPLLQGLAAHGQQQLQQREQREREGEARVTATLTGTFVPDLHLPLVKLCGFCGDELPLLPFSRCSREACTLAGSSDAGDESPATPSQHATPSQDAMDATDAAAAAPFHAGVVGCIVSATGEAVLPSGEEREVVPAGVGARLAGGLFGIATFDAAVDRDPILVLCELHPVRRRFQLEEGEVVGFE